MNPSSGNESGFAEAKAAGELPRILATPSDVLSPRMVRVIEGPAIDWRWLDERIEGLSSEIEELANRDAGCERLMSVPGIGPIISSTMVAAIGSGDGFAKGRDFAAWFGLVPRRISPRIAPARSVRAGSMGRVSPAAPASSCRSASSRGYTAACSSNACLDAFGVGQLNFFGDLAALQSSNTLRHLMTIRPARRTPIANLGPTAVSATPP